MDLMGLNPEQREAVTYTQGPLLVLAGAGSGKTRVLTYKIAYLMEDLKISPSQIMAITFTNKAAKEMKDRIHALAGEKSYGLWMGTFHAISLRILRTYGEKIGYHKGFVIYDTGDQKTLLKQCLKELGINPKISPVKHFAQRISNAKNRMIPPDRIHELYPVDREIQGVYRLYEEKMLRNNGIDFDNILLGVIKLLKNYPDIREFYRRNFQYLLIDEYQDTNKAQYEMISLLANAQGRVFVVGDNDQSIYGWRGADIRNISEFERDFKGARVIKLEQNYRSTNHILKAANGVIQNNLYRKEKNLWSDKGEGMRVRFFEAMSDREEADFVVGQIQNLVDKGDYATKDIAVLYRTNAQSRLFEERFRQCEIPYKIIGGTGFYARREIKDMLAYLRLVVNTQDDVSVQRVINSPKRGIGQKTLEALEALAEDREISIFEAIAASLEEGVFGTRATGGLREFYELIEKFSRQQDTLEAPGILEGLYRESGYFSALAAENSVEAATRQDNIAELISAVTQFTLSEGETLEEFLSSISLLSDVDGLDEKEIGVTLMTLHAAKGLEFPVVFLVGLEEGLFPSHASLDQPQNLEEERRLCYVGMTRAEELLTLSAANQRMTFGEIRPALVSRFIEEIPQSHLEILRERKKKIYDLTNQREPFKGGFPPRTPEAAPGNNKTLTAVVPGMKVSHKVFGLGRVITVEGRTAKIAFEGKGIKQLHIDYAPLEEVDSDG